MKIYIAGKITNNPNYKEQFDALEKELKAAGHLVMNPAILPEGFPWESYMPICYKMIDACECVCMLSNWKDSKGAMLERKYATRKDKVIIYQCEKVGKIC